MTSQFKKDGLKNIENKQHDLIPIRVWANKSADDILNDVRSLASGIRDAVKRKGKEGK